MKIKAIITILKYYNPEQELLVVYVKDGQSRTEFIRNISNNNGIAQLETNSFFEMCNNINEIHEV
jgi:predicted alpha/beta superfamily hydrolase